MGDSPRSLQSLKAAVSLFKKIRWECPGEMISPSDVDDRPLLVGNDTLWWSLACFPYFSIVYGILITANARERWDPFPFMALIVLGGYVFYMAVMMSIIYCHRDMPFRLIGAKAKFMIEVIPMITAAALCLLWEFNYGYLFLLVGFSGYFYVTAHFMRVAYDIEGKDVLLGIIMPALVYMLDVELIVRGWLVGFCLVLSLYRYMAYCAPEVPVHDKKEWEQLPC